MASASSSRRAAHSTALVASAAATDADWYCAFVFNLSNRLRVGASAAPPGPAAFSSATASVWPSALRVVPVSRRQMASLELMPEMTECECPGRREGSHHGARHG